MAKRTTSKDTKSKATAKTTAKKTASLKPKGRVQAKKVEVEIMDHENESTFANRSEITPATAVKMDDQETDLDLIDEGSSNTLPTVIASNKSVATTDPVTLYLNEIRKYPVLTREQEVELAKKYYETKDPVAAQALVTANLRFVVKIAAEYSRFGAKMIDLIQEGNIGLMHAVREFNPYKGVRLITYAVWWIKGYIQEYLMKQYSMVKIGTTQNQRKLFYQLQREKNALENLTAGSDFKALAQKLNIPEDEIIEMSQRMRGRDVSLSQPLDDSSSATLGDQQKSTDTSLDDVIALQEQLNILKDQIDSLRADLNKRELIILDERLLADEPLTLQEIGEKYGITREAVRQAEARLMNKIKSRFLSKSGDIV